MSNQEGLTSKLWSCLPNCFTETEPCRHPEVIGQECTSCRHNVGDFYGIPIDYLYKGLRYSYEEAARISTDHTNDVLTQRKLHLVLDIDETLLHTVFSSVDLNAGEIKRKVWLRPFVHKFLKEANSLFEMYLYTKGSRCYAREMARLLDPQGFYFADRIISRDETPTFNKSLDFVIAEDRAIVIVDDNLSVWPDYKQNLVLIKKYEYSGEDVNGRGECLKGGVDESETEGELARILGVLREIHRRFFKQVDDSLRDVRLVMESFRRSKSILEGCRILVAFCPFGKDGREALRICSMAKELGAECTTKCDSLVTHVIVFDLAAPEVKWAMQNQMFLVHSRWVEAQYLSLQKQPDINFPFNCSA